MKKPKKPCASCGGVITGLRTRFCSNNCAEVFEKERRKRKYDLIRLHLKNRICIVCKKSYLPRTSRQTVCSRSCRIFISNSSRKHKKKIPGKSKKKFGGEETRIANHFITQEIVGEVKMIDKSEFSNEIQEFLDAGGKVTKLSSLPPMQTPSIGVPLRLGGWSRDSLQGFGPELDLMEETNLDLVGLNGY